MNDELSGQLTSKWKIPAYARGSLWLVGNGAAVPVEGEYGLFELPMPIPVLTLRWGGAQGPALAQLTWQADTLEWNGRISAGGYIDSLHTVKLPDQNASVTVFFLGGQPLKSHMHLMQADHSRIPYEAPSFHSAIAAEVSESITTWLVLDASPLAAAAQNAMLHNLRLHLWGKLAEEESWGAQFALPILLEAATLFAP